MKKIASTLIVFITLTSVSLLAGPTPGGWYKQKTLSTTEDFAALEPGDQVAQVCKKCDTVSMIEIESKSQAMALCKEGNTIDCPSCDNVAKVVRTGPPSKSRQKIQFVDDHGDACMFMAKMEPKMPMGSSHSHK
ncbi:hypothetical protein [Ruficoccus sp. ZRK36]|jgi:hypothetical protein|uniref:hypothetical protein n=1 Tax=Ruficoccus sp. ZRK36 TaxID=2866311 RepID=UPI001C72E16B|nr:hypothetical protein [Ruficoccus sp. ZRK36]QYY36742.1 hypothetical protein K0V07_04520 [Ruficoccus sp. ZRK36]|tara:strand:- start:273 stop:674 length:402 start_codon:yes stop_codon:yes gene_type:complete